LRNPNFIRNRKECHAWYSFAWVRARMIYPSAYAVLGLPGNDACMNEIYWDIIHLRGKHR